MPLSPGTSANSVTSMSIKSFYSRAGFQFGSAVKKGDKASKNSDNLDRNPSVNVNTTKVLNSSASNKTLGGNDSIASDCDINPVEDNTKEHCDNIEISGVLQGCVLTIESQKENIQQDRILNQLSPNLCIDSATLSDCYITTMVIPDSLPNDTSTANLNSASLEKRKEEHGGVGFKINESVKNMTANDLDITSVECVQKNLLQASIGDDNCVASSQPKNSEMVSALTSKHQVDDENSYKQQISYEKDDAMSCRQQICSEIESASSLNQQTSCQKDDHAGWFSKQLSSSDVEGVGASKLPVRSEKSDENASKRPVSGDKDDENTSKQLTNPEDEGSNISNQPIASANYNENGSKQLTNCEDEGTRSSSKLPVRGEEMVSKQPTNQEVEGARAWKQQKLWNSLKRHRRTTEELYFWQQQQPAKRSCVTPDKMQVKPAGNVKSVVNSNLRVKSTITPDKLLGKDSNQYKAPNENNQRNHGKVASNENKGKNANSSVVSSRPQCSKSGSTSNPQNTVDSGGKFAKNDSKITGDKSCKIVSKTIGEISNRSGSLLKCKSGTKSYRYSPLAFKKLNYSSPARSKSGAGDLKSVKIKEEIKIELDGDDLTSNLVDEPNESCMTSMVDCSTVDIIKVEDCVSNDTAVMSKEDTAANRIVATESVDTDTSNGMVSCDKSSTGGVSTGTNFVEGTGMGVMMGNSTDAVELMGNGESMRNGESNGRKNLSIFNKTPHKGQGMKTCTSFPPCQSKQNGQIENENSTAIGEAKETMIASSATIGRINESRSTIYRQDNNTTTTSPPCQSKQNGRSENESSTAIGGINESSSAIGGKSGRGGVSRIEGSKQDDRQMVLDFGQKLYGMVQCGKCGMTYNSRHPADVYAHNKLHSDILSQLKFSGYGRGYKVVQELFDGSKIVIINNEDKTATKRIEQVRSIVDQELGFVIDDRDSLGSQSKIFLYVADKQVVGFCLVQPITQAYRMLVNSESGEADSMVSNNNNNTCTKSNGSTVEINDKDNSNTSDNIRDSINNVSDDSNESKGNGENNGAKNNNLDKNNRNSSKQNNCDTKNSITSGTADKENCFELSDVQLDGFQEKSSNSRQGPSRNGSHESSSTLQGLSQKDVEVLRCCSDKPERARLGVSRVWVLSSYRRHQVATKLLDAVRCHAVQGSIVNKQDIAFSDPTPDGMKFAESYTNTQQFLVYRSNCRTLFN